MINIIKECKNPEILVLTPLLPGHKIDKITKKTLKRNDVSFYWISCEKDQNIPKNHIDGINWYKGKFGELPKYIQFIDRDIEACRGLLDKLYNRLSKTSSNVGYAYAGFEYSGHINHIFPALPFDINKLIKANYISSNSMYKSHIIDEVGLVTDDKYKRLLDWAFFIKCYQNGYIGMPESNAMFIAHSTEKDISAGSQDDYRLKYERVFNDFIKPLFK
jgi:hypothetical protein